MSNQRIKNVERTLELVDEYRWATLSTMQKIVSLEIGVTEQKALEYLNLLSFHKKIIVLNGWVVSLAWKGPMPWTEEFAKMQREKRSKEEPELELTAEEKAILGED